MWSRSAISESCQCVADRVRPHDAFSYQGGSWKPGPGAGVTGAEAVEFSNGHGPHHALLILTPFPAALQPAIPSFSLFTSFSSSSCFPIPLLVVSHWRQLWLQPDLVTSFCHFHYSTSGAHITWLYPILISVCSLGVVVWMRSVFHSLGIWTLVSQWVVLFGGGGGLGGASLLEEVQYYLRVASSPYFQFALFAS